MTAQSRTITARFSVVTDAHVPIEHDVRRLLADRGLVPDVVHARALAGTSLLIVDQAGTSQAQADAVLGEICALEQVRSAEYEARNH